MGRPTGSPIWSSGCATPARGAMLAAALEETGGAMTAEGREWRTKCWGGRPWSEAPHRHPYQPPAWSVTCGCDTVKGPQLSTISCRPRGSKRNGKGVLDRRTDLGLDLLEIRRLTDPIDGEGQLTNTETGLRFTVPRWLSALLGLTAVAIGVVLILRPFTSLTVLALLVGVGALVAGVSELVDAGSTPRPWVRVLAGVGWCLAGLLPCSGRASPSACSPWSSASR
ncbi:MAG TPA: DUF308 domain-containing protein [Nakamurella sp.]